MKRKNKKHILFPAALLIYVTVLAVITYPRYRESGDRYKPAACSVALFYSEEKTKDQGAVHQKGLANQGGKDNHGTRTLKKGIRVFFFSETSLHLLIL
jgi:hypothetical protein